MKGVYIKLGIGVFVLGMTGFMATTVVPKAFVSFTKAAPGMTISLADSRVLGEKILARADGIDQCIVNVFVLDKDSKGVAGKTVTMEGMEGITAPSKVTDSSGMAKFTMTSSKEGQFTLTSTVGGAALPGEMKVTFRN